MARLAISVLVRPQDDAEAGDISAERWFCGTAEVPPTLAPSAVLFQGEGGIALFPIEAPVAEIPTDPADDEPPDPIPPVEDDGAKAKPKGKAE